MPAPPAEVDLLTPADAARILDLSVDMVRILATNGQLATAARTARGARLFRREDVEELAATRTGRIVRHHSVQFYESDDHLAGVVANFLADGMRGGAGAILIGTESHREPFLRRLKAAGIAAEQAIEAGQLVLLDARTTLSSFTPDGEPDEALFLANLGSLVAKMREQWSRARLRVYAEMIALLCNDGRRDAAIALEEMSNRLGATQSFALLCAYAMSNFPTACDAQAFDRICREHTRVLPAESFDQDGGIDHKHRQIARLQQRAYAIQRELGETYGR